MPRSAAAAYAVAAPGADLRTRANLPRRVAVSLGVAALVAITLAYPSATRVHTWPWAILGLGLWLLPLVGLIVGAMRCPEWRLPTRTFLVGLLLLAVGTLASALVSPFASASLPRVWPTLGGVALVLWLHQCWSAPDASKNQGQAGPALILAVVGTMIAMAALCWWSGLTWPLPWTARNDFPFGHSTYTAGAMVVLLPWVALQAWTQRGLKRTGWVVATLAMIVVVATTSSRGGVLGLATSTFIATLAILRSGRWSNTKKFAIAGGLLALGVGVVVTNPRLRELVVNRQWGASAAESNSQRRAMIAAGIELGSERPWLGWGAGTVPLAYPHVRARLDAGVDNVLQLHSTPFQLWATHGIAGAGALLLLLVGTGQALRRAPRTPVTTAAGASLLGYAVVALTDHQMDVPLIAGAVVAGTALLLGSTASGQTALRPGCRTRFGIVALLVIATGIPLAATWRDLQARRDYDAALSAFAIDDQATALQCLDQATNATPHDPFFDHVASAAQIKAAGAETAPELRRHRIQDAITRLERSLTTGAHREFAHFNLGWLYLERSEAAAAARHFRSAAALVPDRGGVYFGLGLALRATGANAEAIRAFALEWINDPLSFTTPVWEIDAFATLVPAIRAETLNLLRAQKTASSIAVPLAAWFQWWWQPGPASLTAPPQGWNTDSRAFAAAWPALHTRNAGAGPIQPTAWFAVYEGWRNNGSADAFSAAAGGDTTFAAALARRAVRHRDDFRAFLIARTEGEAPFVRVLQRTRPGYGVLALHPEGPPLPDAYVVQENRVATQFAGGLFPRKGWLPGRLLLALLPENSR